jgi:ATP-binding cassette, subfamily B, bacterial PglK
MLELRIYFNKKGCKSMLKKLLSLFTKREIRGAFFVMSLMVLMAAMELAGILSIVPFLTVISDAKAIDTEPFLSIYNFSLKFGVENINQFLVFLALLSILVIVISAIFRSYTWFKANIYIEGKRYNLAKRLVEHYLCLEFEVLQSYNPAELTKNVLSEIDNLTDRVIRPVMSLVAYSVLVLFIFIALVLYDWKLALSISFIFGSVYGAIFLITKRSQDYYGGLRYNSNEDRYHNTQDIFLGSKSIRMNGGFSVYLDQFRSASSDYAKSIAFLMSLSQIPHFIVEAVAFGGMLILVLFMLLSGNDISSILPMIGLYGFAAYRIHPALRNIFVGITSLKFGIEAVDQLALDFKKETQINALKINSPLLFKNQIKINDVSYNYSDSANQTLKEIILNINKGDKIGIQGTSGAGKSTLTDIIMGLLKPTNGKIELDGAVVSAEDLAGYRALFGYVPQETFIANDSVKNNIAFGLSFDQICNDRVKHCAKISEIHAFITSELNSGYETILDKLGSGLSGGQKQRISIARALYREPSILILDEATSALDEETERKLMKNLYNIKSDITMIIIAHRTSTLSGCNKIITLDDGKIADITDNLSL